MPPTRHIGGQTHHYVIAARVVLLLSPLFVNPFLLPDKAVVLRSGLSRLCWFFPCFFSCSLFDFLAHVPFTLRHGRPSPILCQGALLTTTGTNQTSRGQGLEAREIFTLWRRQGRRCWRWPAANQESCLRNHEEERGRCVRLDIAEQGLQRSNK